MLMRILWILVGYILACVAFGVVLAAFVFTPADIIASESILGRLGMAVAQALLSATQVAWFASLLALVAAIIAEWQRIDEWLYYVVIAFLIAGIGFLAQYASEPQGAPTIGNNYAASAFLTGALVSGLVYWLIAGRHAGSPAEVDDSVSAGVAAEPASEKT